MMLGGPVPLYGGRASMASLPGGPAMSVHQAPTKPDTVSPPLIARVHALKKY